MGTEIEAKYLLRKQGRFYTTNELQNRIPDAQLEQRIRADGTPLLQGYLLPSVGRELATELGLPFDDTIIEARLRDKNGAYSFTLKSDGTHTRAEHQARIARHLFFRYWPFTAGSRVNKIRLSLPWDDETAEFDLYTDRDLIIAEIEAPTREALQRIVPLGVDITSDKSYKNRNLAR